MSATVELGAALAMGLMGSVHCVGMCGGIASVLSSSPAPRCGPAPRGYGGSLAVNGGRLTTYAALGGLAGALGGAFRDALPLGAIGTGARVATAIVLLAVGLHLAGVGKGLSGLEALTRPIFSRLRPLLAAPSQAGALPIYARGLGWGLLPCGLVYGAVALAMMTGEALYGALTMIAFGLGTLPAMLAVGVFASGFVRLVQSPKLRATAGLLVALSGVVHLAMAARSTGAFPDFISPLAADGSLSDERPCCASRPPQLGEASPRQLER